MTIFANEPIGNTKAICKNCGNTCYLGKDSNFCQKCGKPILNIPQNKTLASSDFPDLYNLYFNRDKDIFSDKAKKIFEFYIKNLYSKIEVETVPIINSSLRSGYSIRLAEEKIYKKQIVPLVNIKSILEEAHKSIIETDIKIDSLDEKDGNLLTLGVYLTIDSRYENYYLEKNSMHERLASIIKDNLSYLIPALKKIYEGKTIFHTITGIFPHVFNKPIKFDNELQNRWVTYISGDTIFGYCLKIAESYLTNTT